MSGNVEPISGGVEASIAMMRGTVPEKDTRDGAKIHLMLIVRSEMGKALRAKKFQEGEVWFVMKEKFKG